MSYPTEIVSCYNCYSTEYSHQFYGQDDLTGISGDFPYVKCNSCGLIYQNPRLTIDDVKLFYTDAYIAHRKAQSYGILTPLFNWAMSKHDRSKVNIVKKYVNLNSSSEVLDVGCAVGTFLHMINKRFNSKIAGVDFKDMSYYPGFNDIDFHLGLFYEQQLPEDHYNLITMWHFLEHDYDPRKSLQKAKNILAQNGRIIIEVPRLDSLTYKLYGKRWPGVQAPQHTMLLSKKLFIDMVKSEGFEIIDYLPYGAFPAYFYLFTGFVFQFLKGKGFDIKKFIAPYFVGQVLLMPLLLFEKQLNLSMQTIIAGKKQE